MRSLSPTRARELLNRFPDLRLLVVGDLMLDRYVYGEVERISPEAPVPVVRVTREFAVPGGACNVALNIRALGGGSTLCGVVGTCGHGAHLLRELGTAGVDTSRVFRHEGTTTIVKTRVLADRQQMLRVDRETPGLDGVVDSPPFLNLLAEASADIHGLVLEDYGKGVLTQPVVSRVLENAKTRGIPTGYDPKDNHDLDVRGVTFATPNRKEAFHVAGLKDRNPGIPPLEDPDLLRAAATLRDMWGPEHLMVTLGPQGMLLLSGEASPIHVPTRAREVFDVSGAGDTVIATTMLALAAGANFPEAAALANAAAGIVVGKLGTAVTSPGELLAALEAMP